MDTRTRIRAIGLAEKMERLPGYAAKIGVSMKGLPGWDSGVQMNKKQRAAGTKARAGAKNG